MKSSSNYEIEKIRAKSSLIIATAALIPYLIILGKAILDEVDKK